MALTSVSMDIMEKIRSALGLEGFNRPHAILADAGDFGTVFTYMPLLPAEFRKLPADLQRHVYLIGKERYGLVGHVPKSFELSDKIPIVSITAVYGDGGTLLELGYRTDEKGPLYQVKHGLRREKLLELAKKKKIPIKTTIRSRS
ncbi:MAG: hypothetical protein HQM09_06885 [Candidatus Riflebacteria bacterium]|nr:hypothetical protein [Candidatus Riflebacteria bacterium]